MCDREHCEAHKREPITAADIDARWLGVEALTGQEKMLQPLVDRTLRILKGVSHDN